MRKLFVLSVFLLATGPSESVAAEDRCRSIRVKQLPAAENSTIAPAPRMGPFTTPVGDQLPVWFIKRTDLRMGVLGLDGRWRTPVDQVLESTYQRSGVRAVSNGGCAGVVSVLWGKSEGSRHPADISFATWCSEKGFSGEIPVDPDPQTDKDPEIAAGPEGTYAIAWIRSPSYFTNHLRFALVKDGQVIVQRELVHNAQAEGMSIVFTGSQYVVVYSRSTVGTRGGLVATRIGLDGRTIASGEVFRGRSWLPLAVWDGSHIALAFAWQEHGLGFLRLTPEGQVVGEPRSIDWHQLPRVGYRPTALVRYKSGYLVGFQRDAYRTSNDKGVSSQALVAYLTGDGSRISHPVAVGKHRWGSSSPALALVQSKVLGAFFLAPWSGKDRIETFEVTCRAGRPPRMTREFARKKPKDPCDAVVLGMPVGRYLPMRDVFEVSAIGDNLAVASLGDPGPDGQGKRSLHLSRMTRQGVVKWSRSVEQDGAFYRPALAIDDETIGLVYPKNDGLYFAAYDHDGVQKQAPHRVEGAKGSACLAKAPGGYLLMVLGMGLNGLLFQLDANGHSTGEPVAAPSGMRCALSPADGGFLVAVTRPGEASGTNYLYTQKLNPLGRPVGSEHTIEKKFARSPVLLRQGDGHTLLWTKPLRHLRASEFRAARLGKDGSVADEPKTYGWNRSVGGWGLVPDESGARIVYGTQEDYVERRICPDKPGPHPPPPLRHLPHRR